MHDSEQLQQTRVVNTYVNRGLTLVKGEGAYLFDEVGDRYLDLMSNYGVSIFGYRHPLITQVLTEQLNELPTLHGSFTNDVRALASDTLVQRCGVDYAQVYWSNSGSEANEAALKFAVLATGKKRFIVCDHGYHGKTLGALSATSGEKYKKPFEPLLWEFVSIPFNDVEALERAIDDQTAAFMVEPIQGEGGLFVPSASYLQQVRDICTRKNILLILDEVQTGTGRTGTFLASQAAGISGDIVCLGKGLAGGIPVGATVIRKLVADAIPKHMHTSTFGGNPLTCAGVLATLTLVDDECLERVRTIGAAFRAQLATLKAPFLGEVCGQGLMIGIVAHEKRNALLKALQDQRVLAIPAGEQVVRLLPSYLLQQEDIDFALRAFTNAIQVLA